jgi:hypothetical protein
MVLCVFVPLFPGKYRFFSKKLAITKTISIIIRQGLGFIYILHKSSDIAQNSINIMNKSGICHCKLAIYVL